MVEETNMCVAAGLGEETYKESGQAVKNMQGSVKSGGFLFCNGVSLLRCNISENHVRANSDPNHTEIFVLFEKNLHTDTCLTCCFQPPSNTIFSSYLGGSSYSPLTAIPARITLVTTSQCHFTPTSAQYFKTPLAPASAPSPSLQQKTTSPFSPFSSNTASFTTWSVALKQVLRRFHTPLLTRQHVDYGSTSNLDQTTDRCWKR